MRNVSRLRRDDLDTFVDDLLADPSRAEEIKAVMRQRLRVVPAPSSAPLPAEGEDALERFWDNVPV